VATQFLSLGLYRVSLVFPSGPSLRVLGVHWPTDYLTQWFPAPVRGPAGSLDWAWCSRCIPKCGSRPYVSSKSGEGGAGPKFSSGRGIGCTVLPCSRFYILVAIKEI
jgi:hypothetical protein